LIIEICRVEFCAANYQTLQLGRREGENGKGTRAWRGSTEQRMLKLNTLD